MSYPEMSIDVPWSLVKSGFKKTPRFNTTVQTPAARRGISSVSYMPFPTWDFQVDLNYVEGGEGVKFSVLQKFLGCFMAVRGRGGLFYFTDPNDHGVSDNGIMLNTTPGAETPLGVSGDGASTQFQLARIVDQGIDIIQAVSAFNLYVNGAITVTGGDPDSGRINFGAAPAIGAVLSWQGRFRYLCRFSDDTIQDLARVQVNLDRNGFKKWLWSASSISFQSEFIR